MKSLLKISVLLISIHLSAQQKEFTVFYFSGKIEIIENGVKSSMRTQRDSLFNGDKIILSKGAKIILYRDAGGCMLLKNPATYSVDSLASVVKNTKEQNFASEYLSFIASEAKGENETIEEYSEKYMREKGGVTRGYHPLLFPPFATSMADTEQITFAWTALRGDVSFSIYQVEKDKMPLLSYKAFGNKLPMKMDTLLIDKGRIYYWSVACKEISDYPRYSFKIITKEEIKTIRAEIDSAKNEKSYSKDLKFILQAACYEKHALYILANQEYLNAIKAFPKQQEFKQLYIEFRARTRFNDKL